MMYYISSPVEDTVPYPPAIPGPVDNMKTPSPDDMIGPKVRAFLSFTTKDGATAESLRENLEEKFPYLEILEHPVQETYEQDWQSHCEKKISQSEFVICLVGDSTHRSAAVNWELGTGLALGKDIVAIQVVDGAPLLPEILRANSIAPIYDGLDAISSKMRHPVEVVVS